MWYTHHGVSWEWVFFGELMMILFWGGLIALVAWLFRSYVGVNTNRTSDPTDGDSQYRSPGNALEILKERYARGDISKAEYEEMRDDLRT